MLVNELLLWNTMGENTFPRKYIVQETYHSSIDSPMKIRKWCLFHPSEYCPNIPIWLEQDILLPSAVQLSY